MKKICVVTAARSEYGHLKWLIKDLLQTDNIELQLVVTGGHLSDEQGYTINEIKNDGANITRIVDADIHNESSKEITDTMGRMALGFSEAFAELKPDILVVLGDRYELFPICSTAFMQGIKIAHLSGGDVTEGALDDCIRNAITMLATYHFSSTENSAKNIERMRGNSKNIWNVGATGLDAFNRMVLMNREKLANYLELDISKKWVLMTYHSETRNTLEYNLNAVYNIVKVLATQDDFQIVMTYANADVGGREINEFLEETAKSNPEKFKVVPSLGQLRYLSFMKQVAFVIGNSSSGIIETPHLKIPTVNIGNRQKGRYQCGNIVQCGTSEDEIKVGIEKAMNLSQNIKDAAYYGDGHTTERIVGILKMEIFKNE